MNRAPPNTSSGILERAGTYFVGVAIGLVILGLLWSARENAGRAADSPSADGSPAAGTTNDR